MKRRPCTSHSLLGQVPIHSCLPHQLHLLGQSQTAWALLLALLALSFGIAGKFCDVIARTHLLELINFLMSELGGQTPPVLISSG